MFGVQDTVASSKMQGIICSNSDFTTTWSAKERSERGREACIKRRNTRQRKKGDSVRYRKKNHDTERRIIKHTTTLLNMNVYNLVLGVWVPRENLHCGAADPMI